MAGSTCQALATGQGHEPSAGAVQGYQETYRVGLPKVWYHGCVLDIAGRGYGNWAIVAADALWRLRRAL